MNDYLDEYGDEIADIEDRLKHALEMMTEARKYLRQGSALKASYEVFEAGTIARSIEPHTQGLYRALERDAKQ